jgi:hypothetical protein
MTAIETEGPRRVCDGARLRRSIGGWMHPQNMRAPRSLEAGGKPPPKKCMGSITQWIEAAPPVVSNGAQGGPGEVLEFNR